MLLTLPKIYPLTDARFSPLSLSDQVEKMLVGGARFIQLRAKSMSGRELFDEAQRSIELCRDHGAKLIVNDRVDIALAAKAHGVHLGQDDFSPRDARKIIGDDAIIGLSTHSVEQALTALNEPINYIAIGPIYSTNSKSDTSPVVGLEGIKAVRAVVGEIPLVAIGGINAVNIRDVLSAGADSAAVISAVFSNDRSIGTSIAGLLEKCSSVLRR